MIQTPIRQVLLTIQVSGTRTLLMGWQACVFYGAAQVSKDVDFLILADEANFKKLRDALAILAANRIASLAADARLPELRAALDVEVRVEQDKDRLYWEPLKREMEAFRRAERGA